jgi:hypothetical protein
VFFDLIINKNNVFTFFSMCKIKFIWTLHCEWVLWLVVLRLLGGSLSLDLFAGVFVHCCNNNHYQKVVKYFTPVICFLLFNVGDWTGRSLTGLVHLVSLYNALYVCVSGKDTLLYNNRNFEYCRPYELLSPFNVKHPPKPHGQILANIFLWWSMLMLDKNRSLYTNMCTD